MRDGQRWEKRIEKACCGLLPAAGFFCRKEPDRKEIRKEVLSFAVEYSLRIKYNEYNETCYDMCSLAKYMQNRKCS